MAEHYGRQMDDDKVWFDLYLNDYYKGLIVEHHRKHLMSIDADVSITLVDGRLQIMNGDRLVSSWFEYNKTLVRICNGLKIMEDIMRDMIFVHELTDRELSFITTYHPSSLRQYLKTIGLDQSVSRPSTANAVHGSSEEQILLELMEKSGVVCSRGVKLQYVCDGKRSHTIPDFIIGDKVAIYVDGYTHELAITKERDDRQNRGLPSLGYRVLRIRTEYLFADSYPTVLAFLKSLAIDRNVPEKPFFEELDRLLKAERKRRESRLKSLPKSYWKALQEHDLDKAVKISAKSGRCGGSKGW